MLSQDSSGDCMQRSRLRRVSSWLVRTGTLGASPANHFKCLFLQPWGVLFTSELNKPWVHGRPKAPRAPSVQGVLCCLLLCLWYSAVLTSLDPNPVREPAGSVWPPLLGDVCKLNTLFPCLLGIATCHGSIPQYLQEHLCLLCSQLCRVG